MEIVYINDQLLPTDESDAEQFMLTVAALGAAGASVKLLLPRRNNHPGPSFSELISYYRIRPSFRLEPVRSLFPTHRIIEKTAHAVACFRRGKNKTTEIIHSRNLLSILLGLFSTTAGVAYETYLPWPLQYPILNPFFNLIARRHRFLGIIAHSRLTASSFQKIGVPAEKLLVAHNGYCPERISPRIDKPEARAAIGIVHDRPLVVYTGHVSEGKGLEMVLNMARRMPETEFYIVGSTRQTSIEHQAKRIPNVRVVAWQPFNKVLPYLYAADVLLIPPTARPLLKEGRTVLPLKTFLYMAAGRAILAPSTLDVCEILQDGKNACLVPPDDLSMAVQGLRLLLNDHERMSWLGRTAEIDALNYTYDRRARLILDFFSSRLQRLQQHG